jgi:hypothetical protein
MYHDFRGFKFPRKLKELLSIRMVINFIDFPTMTKCSYTHRVFYYRIISFIDNVIEVGKYVTFYQ